MAQDLSNFTPEVWSVDIQDTLDKTLVAKEVCNTKLTSGLSYGDTVHFPYIGNVTAHQYVDAVGVTVNDVNPCDETMMLDQQYDATVYISTKDIIQNKYSTAKIYQERCAYALRDKIDSLVLAEVANAGLSLTAGDLTGGSGSGPITATTSNIIEIFSKARMKLAQNNVTDSGDFVAIITPAMASLIEQKFAATGFSVSDSTLRNGYAGDVLGWKVYVSNNVYSPASIDYNLFMKRGAIALGLQKDVTVEVKDAIGSGGSSRLGQTYIAWALWGIKTFHSGAQMMVSVNIAE